MVQGNKCRECNECRECRECKECNECRECRECAECSIDVRLSLLYVAAGKKFCCNRSFLYFRAGEMAERFNAAVLKTVDCNRSGGSNPSLSAYSEMSAIAGIFVCESK